MRGERSELTIDKPLPPVLDYKKIKKTVKRAAMVTHRPRPVKSILIYFYNCLFQGRNYVVRQNVFLGEEGVLSI